MLSVDMLIYRGGMAMDIKEQKMLQHYKRIIENREFDEYDILGFLIFIRRHLHTESNYIQEFADLVAHRERKRGIVVECITNAINSNYKTKGKSREVISYRGMKYETWVKQWKNLGIDLNINISKEIIKEITLCVFSLAQHTLYDDEKGHSGKMDLFQGKDKSIALTTLENNSHSLFVCFAKFGKFDFVRNLSAGYMRKPVETIRKDGRLRLLDEDGYII